jgi:hypothetical protein
MPGLPGMPDWRPGLNVEAFQYAETSHVLHVLFFRVLKTFQDLRLTGISSEAASGEAALRGALCFAIGGSGG